MSTQQPLQTLTTALLTRNPTLTQSQFSHHWLTHHAAIVTPYFIHIGVSYYAQIHGPLSSPLASDINLALYHGAAEVMFNSEMTPGGVEQWVVDYYNEVVLVDEKRLLVSAVEEHCVRVGEGSVFGDGGRKVVIRDGKGVGKVPEEVWGVWRGYEARGRR